MFMPPTYEDVQRRVRYLLFPYGALQNIFFLANLIVSQQVPDVVSSSNLSLHHDSRAQSSPDNSTNMRMITTV